MREHQEFPPAHDLSPRSIPLSQIWSFITSEVGGAFTAGTATPTHPGGAASTSAATAMVIPVSTITVDTTIVRTSFITVPVPTDTTKSCSTSCSSSTSLDPSSGGRLPIASNGHHTSPPAITTGSALQGSPSMTISLRTHQPVIAPSATASPTDSAAHSTQEHAIIGGLSGAIAGLVLIGVFLCYCVRRRRPPRDEEDELTDEKGLRPAIVRQWSQLTTSTTVARPMPAVSRGSTPDFDGGLIRMSLEHWPRPFAHNESFRESVGPGRLRVMNPDPSRPTTPLPRGSSESNGSFLKRQRSAIAAVLLGANRSRGSSVAGSSRRDLHVPAISVNPALSSESIAPYARTPSFRSYPSVNTLPIVLQQPPEDPFLTPPDERTESEHPTPEARPRRPRAAPLQAAGRTLSHISSMLNPFQSKTNFAESVKSSRNSFLTFSSAGDPFKLDRPSIYEGNGGRAASELERQPMPIRTTYEGT